MKRQVIRTLCSGNTRNQLRFTLVIRWSLVVRELDRSNVNDDLSLRLFSDSSPRTHHDVTIRDPHTLSRKPLLVLSFVSRCQAPICSDDTPPRERADRMRQETADCPRRSRVARLFRNFAVRHDRAARNPFENSADIFFEILSRHYGNTIVRCPARITRSSLCNRTARARTVRSISLPRATRSAADSACVTRITLCSMMGPSSRSAVT